MDVDDPNPRLHFPVACPICGKMVVMDYQPEFLFEALEKRKPIDLYASCHDKTWSANETEIEGIRHLVDRWLKS